MAAHSFFQSTTIQHKIIDGKEEGEEKHVEIKNGTGTKTVKQIKNGKTVSNTTVPLTPEEVENAKNKVFMPKFWGNCKPGNNCAIQNNTNNNNTKKNNNKNNSKKNASNKNTKKRRRH